MRIAIIVVFCLWGLPLVLAATTALAAFMSSRVRAWIKTNVTGSKMGLPSVTEIYGGIDTTS
jgi:hypothetical protein